MADPDESVRWTEDRVLEAELGAELVQLLLESYGTGAGDVRVLFGEDAVVAFFDDLELQKSEEFLIARGHEESVLAARSSFQQAIEATFRAAVERIIGRRVTSFASLTKLDPNYAVEIFRLAPRREAVDLDDPDRF